MVIKKKFSLLSNTPNILSLSPTVIKSISIDNGYRKVFVTVEMSRRNINHFTKDKVIKLVTDVKKDRINVINLQSYSLPVSYNKPTKKIVINLSPFGVDDITPSQPGERNIYACVVYGICFEELVTGRSTVSEKHFAVITNYINSILIRSFGKKYGLLGTFAVELPKLKFLTCCYILASFFGVTGTKAYRKASIASTYDYSLIEKDLNKYDFSDIKDFIKALSDLKVMPGLNVYMFLAEIVKRFGFNFLPALEDLSRFISILTASNIPGTSVVPSFLSKYDETSFNNILQISKSIFKRR
jgi:hypothetical protein